MVLRDRTRAVEVRQLAQGVAAHRRPKATVDEVDELWPRRHAAVALEAVVPLLSRAFHVVGGREDLLIFRRAVRPEELLTLMKPSGRILCAVVLRKAQLVGWRRRKRWRLLHVVVFVVVLLAGMSGRELVGLQTIDGDGEAALIVVISSRTEVISAKILSMLVLKSVAESASPIVEVAMAMRRCTARRMAAAVGRRGETQERSRRRIKRIDTR